jgi:hypothetical protein
MRAPSLALLPRFVAHRSPVWRLTLVRRLGCRRQRRLSLHGALKLWAGASGPALPTRGSEHAYSEAQFKTLKYRPGFPQRFDSIEHARDRARVVDAAYAATPERFVRQAPRPPALPTRAWINKPTDTEKDAH